MIPFKKLPIDQSDVDAVTKVLEAKSLSMGSEVSKLEKEFADYVGSAYAVAVNSCTSAIFLSLMYEKIKHRTQKPLTSVAIPSMTVPLVANCVIHAILQIEWLDEVSWVGHSYNIGNTNIWDSAHEVKKRKFKQDEIYVYSFYPTKPICSAEGGMICTNDKDAVNWLRKARWWGRDEGLSKVKCSWEYDMEFAGWKMNMTDIQAAIARNQLRKFPQLDRKRTAIRKLYNQNLKLKNTSNYLYRINVNNRDKFVRKMLNNGIQCGVHFKPLHGMQCYRKWRASFSGYSTYLETYEIYLDKKRTYDIQNKDLPKTIEEYNTTVSLPFYDSMEIKEVNRVCEFVHAWWKNEGGLK